MTEPQRRTTQAFLRPIDLTFKWKWLERLVETIIGIVLAILAAVLSPVMEKNPVKLMSAVTPFVFSMSRISVAVFTAVDAYRIAMAQSIGWPEATLALGCMFAIPLLRALDKVSAQEALAFGTEIVKRFGVGDAAPPHAGMDSNEEGAYHDDDPR